MPSQPNSWINFLTKLKFPYKKVRSRTAAIYGRKLRYEVCEDRRMLTTFYVNVNYDTTQIDNDNTVVSLREAVFRANEFPNHDTIVFNVGSVTLDNSLNVTEPVKIEGGTIRPSNSYTDNQKAFILSPKSTGGLGDLNAASTITLSNLNILGFVQPIRIYGGGTGSTVPVAPESVVITDNDITTVTGSNISSIGIHYTGSPHYPFKFSSNTITGAGVDSGIHITASSAGPLGFEPSANSWIEDNDISSFAVGMRFDSTLLPNLFILGGEISRGGISSNVSVTGISITGDTRVGAYPDQHTVGSISGTKMTGVSTGIIIRDADAIEIIDVDITSNGPPSGISIIINGDSSDNLVSGGILNSSHVGVRINTTSGGEPTGNRVTETNYTSATGLAIILTGSGVPVNDPGDTDGGANGYQNHLEFFSASPTYVGTGWNQLIKFDAYRTGDYTIEFYAGVPSGTSTTLRYVDSRIRSMQAGGKLDELMFFSADPNDPNDWQAGEYLYASVTGPLGNTSGLVQVAGQLVASGSGALPTIADIKLSGSGWTEQLPYSFATRVEAQEQYRPIFTAGANTISIQLPGVNSLSGNELILAQTTYSSGGTVDNAELSVAENTLRYDGFDGLTAMWTVVDSTTGLPTALPDGKYAIQLDVNSISGPGGVLDAEWTNGSNGSPDDITDDPSQSFSVNLGDNLSGTASGEFSFHFALLAGDYNGNGIIEHGSEGVAQDATGDGTLDIDFGVDGDALPFQALGGADFNDDEKVNLEDFYILSDHHLTTGALPEEGDANGDGTVSQLDFRIWRDITLDEAIELESAWFVGGMGSVATSVAGVPPMVTNFTISGTNSVDAPYEFASILSSGEQLRSVPVAGADSVDIQFSEEVAIAMNINTLQVTNLDGISPSAASSYSYDFNTQTATWTFSSPFADGRHLFSLANAPVDLAENVLDGEINNPWELAASSAPIAESGNGEAGGDFRFRATILSNDTDHDNIDGATDYTEWASIEPGMILVSNENDELDSDYSVGDLSLREAVQLANAASEPTTIILPEGRYALTRMGFEIGDGSYNDLDVTGNVTILGDGAGLSVIAGFGTGYTGFLFDERIFSVVGTGSRLELDGLTITGLESDFSGIMIGNAVYAGMDSTVLIRNSAFVSNSQIGPSWGGGVGTAIGGGTNSSITILRSVFTANTGYQGGAVYSTGSELTIGESIFALNNAIHSVPNVYVPGNTVLTNLGNNLYDDASGGFFDTTPGIGDYLGAPDYIVTTIEDTFDHTDNTEALSVREAIDLANQASGTQEIWAPAWDFVLTRDRATYGGGSVTDMDIAFGDLDITENLVIRGVAGKTSVRWAPGLAVDAVFDLLGDYTGDGINSSDDGDVGFIDWYAWTMQYGSTNGIYSADGDDDGDVDWDDYDILSTYYGTTFELIDVLG